jgi:hypothetical protein
MPNKYSQLTFIMPHQLHLPFPNIIRPHFYEYTCLYRRQVLQWGTQPTGLRKNVVSEVSNYYMASIFRAESVLPLLQYMGYWPYILARIKGAKTGQLVQWLGMIWKAEEQWFGFRQGYETEFLFYRVSRWALGHKRPPSVVVKTLAWSWPAVCT